MYVHGHRDTPTQRLRMVCSILVVYYTINYYFARVYDMCLTLYRYLVIYGVYYYYYVYMNSLTLLLNDYR